jgi:type I restriction enzyme M protein
MHRDVRDVTGDEEIVRAYLIHRLVNDLGYRADLIEVERGYEAGRPKSIVPRIDAILKQKDGNAFFFIEAKAPDKFESDKDHIDGQLFKLAGLHEAATGKSVRYLVYYSIEEHDGDVIDKAIVIDRSKYRTNQEWIDAGEPPAGNALTPKYNKPKKEPLVKNGERDLAQSFSIEDIRALAAKLHNVLWGGGSTGDTEVFSALVNLILAKIQDEYDTSDGQEYRFQVIQHGDDLERPDELFPRINDLYRNALTQQLNKRGDLSDQWVVNKEKFSLTKVAYTVRELEKYSFVDGKNSLNGKDILGDFFEQIQREGFKQTKGQFFTPVSITRFMLYAMELDTLAVNLLNREQRLPYLIDPSCGSATFLIEAMKMVTDAVKRRRRGELLTNRSVTNRFEELFTPDHREHKWARDFLYGIEHNFELATASKVNMILHGDGSSNIFQKDGLKPFRFYEKPSDPNILNIAHPNAAYADKEANEQFDAIATNPPFSVSLDDETKRYLDSEFLFGRKKNSENLFVERWWQLLKPGGRLSAVMPESVFDTTENRYIRIFLYRYFTIVAVVSLPQIAFEPYTQTKTSLLFARKKTDVELATWDQRWHDAAKEWAKLVTRIENYRKVFVEGDAQSRFPSIKSDTDRDVRANVERMLRERLTPTEGSMSLKDLFESKAALLDEATQADTDTADVFGRVNVAWVFAQVAAATDYRIFVAEARQVGYKRTKRGERPQPNDLFDLECAPDQINLDDIRATYEDEATKCDTDSITLAARSSALADGDGGPGSSNEKARLQARSNAAKERSREIRAELARVESLVTRCYDAKGLLRDKHRPRLDQELQTVFALPRMARWRSEAILIRDDQHRTLLDIMRRERLWS